MRIRGVIAAIGAIALGTLLVASPASAATLPDGQQISVADNIFDGEDRVQLFDTSPANAFSTAIGAVQFPPMGVLAIDVNDDGFGYALENTVDDEDNDVVHLWQVDANTGVFSNPVTVTPTDEFKMTNCTGLDLQPDGSIIIACLDWPAAAVEDSYVGVVTPAGAFTPFVTSGVNNVPVLQWSAIAYNAVTGELWGWAQDQMSGAWFSYPINRVAGTVGAGILTFDVADPEDPQAPVYGADFDRDGQLFVTTQEGESPIALATLVPGTGAMTIIDEITDVDGLLDAPASLTVWGKTLPATGPAEIVPLGIGTALLFLAGAAFIATSRMQRRAD